MTSDCVRQSSFALLGDLTKAFFELVQPHMEKVMPILAENLQPEVVSVQNNATWAVGKIAMKLSSAMESFVALSLQQHIETVNRQNQPKTLMENTAITLG